MPGMATSLGVNPWGPRDSRLSKPVNLCLREPPWVLNYPCNNLYPTLSHHHHFWWAPLRVRSAERRHQSPERTVLSQVNCVVHNKVAGFQILLNGFHPCNTRTSQWSRPVSCGEAVKICFASISSGIRAMCPNRDRRLDWTTAERWGWEI